ncbi:uncharacterized protein [Zea mays]|uniref:uncharacterized protein isoform X2 n=1 Tax=Zea mays TaxID=4577 RepID=UPI0009A9F5A2|nr:uncharacterized protein LOC118476889 isoform X2 [Zea mays]XP_035823119.1 uncharacterized protein LOC118476889 isoform X2 [Zea mays]|eukprot:XP_020408097.1 uncharacterized protein LOC103653038 isoform X2 [Zea mays]
MPDKSQWPHVDLPFAVAAPLDKRGRGRYKKLRIKSCLEGGNSKSKKAAAEKGKEADKEAANEVDMQAENQTEKGKKKMIRGKRRCKKCGELGHGETSYKCPLNGTKKRKRKPRKNTTKYGENAKVPTQKKSKECAAVQEMEEGAAVQEMEEVAAIQEMEEGAAVQNPTKPTMETIINDSPIRVTRSRLAMLLGVGPTSQEGLPSASDKMTTPTKLTPRKLRC